MRHLKLKFDQGLGHPPDTQGSKSIKGWRTRHPNSKSRKGRRTRQGRTHSSGVILSARTEASRRGEAKNLSGILSANRQARTNPPVKTYHVYIMASASRVLYVGVTSDLVRRVFEHKHRSVPGFTARYRVTELVYFEAFGDIRIAITREKQIKGWLRARKIALIDSFNPHWRDLAAELQSPKPQRDSSLRSE